MKKSFLALITLFAMNFAYGISSITSPSKSWHPGNIYHHSSSGSNSTYTPHYTKLTCAWCGCTYSRNLCGSRPPRYPMCVKCVDSRYTKNNIRDMLRMLNDRRCGPNGNTGNIGIDISWLTIISIIVSVLILIFILAYCDDKYWS